MEASDIKEISVLKPQDRGGPGEVPGESGRRQIARMLEEVLLSPRELEARKIIHQGQADTATLNTYRELRTKLLARAEGSNFVCMVSSVCPGGGASHVAMNLAACIALEPSKTTLLIDCNLYSPTVDKMLTLTPEVGLTNFLDDEEADVRSIIYASGIPRLRVIPVGSLSAGAAEQFSSGRMQQLIAALKSRYPDRFIIIDAPAVTGAAETRILASVCDMALLVVPYGKVNDQQIESGIEALGQDKLAGLVWNHPES